MSAALSLPSPAEREDTAAFVLSLRARGVFDTHVLRAMETVPREMFAPRRYADLSRSDVALPLACGQTMTAPAAVAAMLAALQVVPGSRVLEVGTGSGYVAALLARMGAEVRSIERQATLADSARLRLARASFGGEVSVEHSDGLCGPLDEARYDRILLNGSVCRLAPALTSRIAAHGRLVAALAEAGGPVLLTVTRNGHGELDASAGAPLRIAPLRDLALS